MTAADFRAAMEELGLKPPGFAVALRMTREHVYAILRGDTPVTPTVALLVRLLRELPAARRIVGI